MATRAQIPTPCQPPSQPQSGDPGDPCDPGDAAAPDAAAPDAPAPDAPADFVAGLRRRLIRRLGELGPNPPASVLVVGYGERRSRILARGEDPAATLFDFVLPDRYRAVATIAASVVATSTGADLANIETTLAIATTRQGQQMSFLRDRTGRLIETYKPRGWLADAGMVAVGQASAPTRLHPLELPLALWLDRTMVGLVERLEAPDWRRVAALCPVPAAHRTTDPVALGHRLAAVTPSWSDLRSGVIQAEPAPVPVQPSWARWMDDSMFARWCVGYFPELDDLRADLAFLAPTSLAAMVETTIASAYRSFECRDPSG